MASPFPGMDPYLEDPATWTGVHAAILAAVFEQLGPAVRPKYVVRFEERVFANGTAVASIGAPDAHPGLRRAAELPTDDDNDVPERSLHVLDVRDRSVVTVIELLSPTNKLPGSFGRASFLRKRREVLAGDANWMEIDLLRDGLRTPPPATGHEADYRVYLSRSGPPRDAVEWPIRLPDRLPVVPVPLRGDDLDVPVDLQAAVAAAVERGSYDLDGDYAADPVPPLAGPLAAWARGVVST